MYESYVNYIEAIVRASILLPIVILHGVPSLLTSIGGSLHLHMFSGPSTQILLQLH